MYWLLIKFQFLQGYERIEFILTILGMIATFLGAYIGAKIAGNNSRKIFKQEIKMNDLQQHMDANISVLEEITEVGSAIEKIEGNLKTSYPFHPETLGKIVSSYAEIYKRLNKLKKNSLKESSIIVYHDVFQLKSKVDNQRKVFELPINKAETRQLIEKTLNLKVVDKHWVSWTKDNFNHGELEYEHLRQPHELKGENYNIPISDMITKNKDFFDDKLKDLRNGLNEIKSAYNNMNYKSIEDLKKNYIELFEG